MLSVYIPHNYALFTASLILPYHYNCDYHVCRNAVADEQRNQFTPKGVQQIKEAVRNRNSVGDMTGLKLLISEPLQYTMPMSPSLLPIANYT